MRLRCCTLLRRGRRLLRLLLAACRCLELCPPLLVLAHELCLLSAHRVSSLELAAEIGNLGGSVSSKLGARRAVHLTERTQRTAHQPLLIRGALLRLGKNCLHFAHLETERLVLAAQTAVLGSELRDRGAPIDALALERAGCRARLSTARER